MDKPPSKPQSPVDAEPSRARRSQRIELAEPLPAVFGDSEVTVIELSDKGASIEHAEALPIGRRDRLHIEAREMLEVTAVLRHSVMIPAAAGHGAAYRSGVVFEGVSETTAVLLESILVSEAAILVRLWEANASGRTSSPMLLSMQRRSARRTAPSYIWLTFARGEWQRVTTRDPNQPVDGFAVPASETPQQLALLCETYEQASPEERKLIRALAQLAIAENIRDRRE